MNSIRHSLVRLLVALCAHAFSTNAFAAEAMFGSGAAGDVTAQMNRMWATFGRGEDVRLVPFGNSPGWFEWMARRHCWSDTPEYRERLRTFLIDWPVSKPLLSDRDRELPMLREIAERGETF